MAQLFSYRKGYSKAMYWKDMHTVIKAQYGRLKRFYAIRKEKHEALKKEHSELKLAYEKLQKKHDREILKLTKNEKELNVKIRRLYGMVKLYKFNGKKRTAENALIKKQLRVYYVNKRFFSKEIIWYDRTSIHAERVINMVFSYEKLRGENIANMREIVYLFAGSQLEYFHVQDVANKFGSEWTIGYQKILTTMCKLSYIKQIPRKKAWFITELGEKRLSDIIYALCMGRPKPYIKNELP